jgi:hypothetical protein
VGHASSFLLLVLSGHYGEIINLFLFGAVSDAFGSLSLSPDSIHVQKKTGEQTRVSGTPLMRYPSRPYNYIWLAWVIYIEGVVEAIAETYLVAVGSNCCTWSKEVLDMA